MIDKYWEVSNMINLIIWEQCKHIMFIIAVVVAAWAILIFSVIGIYDCGWKVPSKNTQIEQLNARIQELEQIIAKNSRNG